VSCLSKPLLIERVVTGTWLEHYASDTVGIQPLVRASGYISTCLQLSEPLLTTDSLVRRAGAAWFTLGKTLLEYPRLGLGPILRSCHLLSTRILTPATTAHGYIEACKATQLDLRYSTLATCLENAGLRGMAAIAILKAMQTSASILTPSSSGQGSPCYALSRRFFRCKFPHEPNLNLENVLEEDGFREPWVVQMLQAECSGDNGLSSVSLPHEALERSQHASRASVIRTRREEMAACQAHVSSLIKNGATDDIIGASVKTHLLCQQALASDKEPLERLWSAI